MSGRDVALGLMWGFAAGMAAEFALARFEAASHHVQHPPTERSPSVPTDLDGDGDDGHFQVRA